MIPIRTGDGTVLWSSGGRNAVPDEQNPVARWEFSEEDVYVDDGEEYMTITDQSKNGNDLTGEGVTHATEAINGLPAADFNGTSGYLQGLTASAVDLCSTSTVASVYIAWQSHDATHHGYLISQMGLRHSLQEFSHLHCRGTSGSDQVLFRRLLTSH